MNYRLTPLHFLALFTVIEMIYEIIEISKIKGDPGLGGLGPYVMLGLTLVILFIDLIIQMTFKRSRLVFIIEICLITAAVIYYYIEIN